MPANVDPDAAPEVDDVDDGAGFEPEEAVEPSDDADVAPETPLAASVAAAVAQVTGPHGGPSDDEIGDEDEDEDVAAPPPGVRDAASPPRRELDQNLRAILQEEVAREMAARAADGEPLAPVGRAEPEPDRAPGTAMVADDQGPDSAAPEDLSGPDTASPTMFDDDTLPDIGPAPESGRVADVFASGAGAGATGAAAAADKAARRDLFPDIDEINSTLDGRGISDADEDDDGAEGRGGFRRGFFAIVFIAALALALYLVAPRLAGTIPALEPALNGYVAAVNGARDWLDATLRGVTDRIAPDE